MLPSEFSNIRRTQFDHSSPVQPVSESWGGGCPKRDGEGQTNKQTKEILVSNFGFVGPFIIISQNINLIQLPNTASLWGEKTMFRLSKKK